MAAGEIRGRRKREEEDRRNGLEFFIKKMKGTRYIWVWEVRN